ncbi:hypothetical protein VYA_31200 [Vibrio alfacsensis]|nr:hypothetical protein VYA_31200 [Vibrio alfacsensis]
MKQLLGGKLSLRKYNAQIGETCIMIKYLNKLTGICMCDIQRIFLKLINFKQFDFIQIKKQSQSKRK